MSLRHYSPLDRIITQLDRGLAILCASPIATRPNPANDLAEPTLTAHARKQSTGYMRVNHAGEVCAQALYQGQILTARHAATRDVLEQAASEEIDHLAWCDERLQELGGHRSYLNSLWYIHSLTLGMVAGLAGDRLSLGFVEETERQVQAHLARHLDKLPTADEKSRKIVAQMRIDEMEHGQSAQKAGATELPPLIKKLMALPAKLMTTVAYWI